MSLNRANPEADPDSVARSEGATAGATAGAAAGAVQDAVGEVAGTAARDIAAPDLGSQHAAPLRDGLTSLQLAFREASTIPDAPGEGPGERFTGSVV